MTVSVKPRPTAPTKRTANSGDATLARAIHDRVLQRLAAASMVMSARAEAYGPDLERASSELQQGIDELRVLLNGRIVALEAAPGCSSADESMPEIVRSVLDEALLYIAKHASPTEILVRVRSDRAGLDVEIVNDGVDHPRPGSGLGLRLAAIEARSAGVSLEWGPTQPGRWYVRVRTRTRRAK